VDVVGTVPVAAVGPALAAAGSFGPEGPVAQAMADLFWLMTALGTVVLVAVLALLLLGLRRRGDEPLPPLARSRVEDDPPATTATLTRRWLILGGVVLPLIVIVVVFAATLVAMRSIPVAAPDGALQVEVVAHQFWWEIHYPEQGVTTANELYLPVGRPVALQLTASDVIHSLWVPALGGKLDALPDGTTTLVLEADQAGEHETECAEFCGLQHANMGLLVVAEPPEAFEEWITTRAEAAAEPTGAAAERGREVFLRSDCARCHAVEGTSQPPADRGERDHGPDLTHVASRRTLLADTVPNTPEDLERVVRDAAAVKPGVTMPPTELSDQEIDDLLAYLGGLQ
jgi:cytochrome c oxidase subunit 2